MIIKITLEQEDYDHMHDVIYEALDFEPSNEEIQAIWDKLPEDIKGTAIQWGTSDTVFRDKLYVYLETNKESWKK